MSRTSSVGARWRRLLPWAVAALAFLGLALSLTPDTPAQGKKDTKAKSAKEEKETKEAPRPEPTIPKRVDIVDSTRGGIEQITYIDDLIAKGWKENKVQPSERCKDETFIRRATLDIIGRIPTHAEINKFLNDPTERRRTLLIDRLIESEDFAQNMANLWTILLMTRTGSREEHRGQMQDWLMRKFMGKDEPPDWSKIAHDLIAGTGETNKNQAVNFVLAHLGEEIKENPANNGKYDFVPVTSRTTRLFLGIRTQCVQCHDHPFHDSLGQHHFWGINAFFRQVDPSGRPTAMMVKKVKGVVGIQNYTVRDSSLFNVKGIVPYERRNAVLLFTDPTFLDGKKMKKGESRPRREVLAEFITRSPDFSKAFVNRIWGHFFGKSFTKDAVDDFGDHNPVSHPELLTKLADDWAHKYNHNPKVLVRWICNSLAYGLKAQTNKYNDKVEDEVFFSRMLLKPMTPEQLFESLMTACESKVAKNKEELRAKKADWLKQLIVNFGNDEGEEGSFSGTVVQALILINGKEINDEIMSKDGTVAAALREKGANHTTVLKYLYRSALSRYPSDAELKHLLSDKMKVLPRSKQDSWEGYYQDVFWALLNSNEFLLNH